MVAAMANRLQSNPGTGDATIIGLTVRCQNSPRRAASVTATASVVEGG